MKGGAGNRTQPKGRGRAVAGGGCRAIRKMGRNGRKEKQQKQILLENVITGANEVAQLVKLSYDLRACAHSTRIHASEKTPQ